MRRPEPEVRGRGRGRGRSWEAEGARREVTLVMSDMTKWRRSGMSRALLQVSEIHRDKSDLNLFGRNRRSLRALQGAPARSLVQSAS